MFRQHWVHFLHWESTFRNPLELTLQVRFSHCLKNKWFQIKCALLSTIRDHAAPPLLAESNIKVKICTCWIDISSIYIYIYIACCLGACSIMPRGFRWAVANRSSSYAQFTQDFFPISLCLFDSIYKMNGQSNWRISLYSTDLRSSVTHQDYFTLVNHKRNITE